MLAEPSIEKKLKRLSESPEMAGECIASLLQTLNVHNPVATLRRITQYPTLQEKKSCFYGPLTGRVRDCSTMQFIRIFL